MTDDFTPTPEEQGLRDAPNLSEADAARLIDTTRVATAIDHGVPPGRAVLAEGVEGIKTKINDLRAELAKTYEGSARGREITDQIIQLTAQTMRLESHVEHVDTTTVARQETAAVNAAPLFLPPLSQSSGLSWDKPGLRSLRSAMHAEGVGEFFQGSLGLISELVRDGSGVPEVHELADVMRARWGSEYAERTRLVGAAWELLQEKAPTLARSLEAQRLDLHPRLLDHLARVGERLLDPVTVRGLARRAAGIDKRRAALRGPSLGIP